MDALGILKAAVKRSDAPELGWEFVDERSDLSGIDSRNVNEGEHYRTTMEVADGTAEMNLVGILKGDVDGPRTLERRQWAMPISRHWRRNSLSLPNNGMSKK